MLCITGILLIAFFIVGCEQPVQTVKVPKKAETADLGTTIGALAEVFSLESIPVEGYGLAGGLAGTGSAECPPQIREYLKRYIPTQLPVGKINVEKFIGSRDTAVVFVHGITPTAASKNQYFDVRVVALPGTQTTSLKGGWLYEIELKPTGSFGITTKVIAHAEGPVFIDTVGTSVTDKKVGYVLAGGTVLDEYKINLALRQPDHRMASEVRNRLIERFGSGIVKAIGPGMVELEVPAGYKRQKQRFISIINEMYLSETPEITKERIRTLVTRLAVSEHKEQSEVALEAIGKESLGKLAILLNSSNEEVRLRAARCMLNLGSDEGLNTLRQIALDKDSPYRIQALEAITTAANRNDAATISRRLLLDDDFDIRLAAYEQLRKLDDIAIITKLVARNFYLEQITLTRQPAIFAARSGQPRIVLFGAPIRCRKNIFVQSADGNITINAPAGQKYVSIMRKHPIRPAVIGPLKTSFNLADIIQTLCEEPRKDAEQGPIGLGVSYDEAIALIKQMCDKGVVKAEFRAGPLPKIG